MKAMFDSIRPELPQKVVMWANEIRAWNVPWETGIYPAEMAAFLGLCDHCDIQTIVESGRGEGYSSQILGKYAELTGVNVTSIDWELNSPVAARCRERMQAYPHLKCIVGDSFKVFPTVVAGLPGPIGILLDGPKLEAANLFSLVASALFDIRVLAHHNCPPDDGCARQFKTLFPDSFYYEQLGLTSLVGWQDFKQWEHHCVRDYETSNNVQGRSLDVSSLAMAVISSEHQGSERLFKNQDRLFRYKAIWLWLKWARKRAIVVRRKNKT